MRDYNHFGVNWEGKFHVGTSVYVMVHKETGNVKIGRARRPSDRCHHLGRLHGKFRLHFSTPCVPNGTFIEALAHKLLSAKRVDRPDGEREWYSAEPDEAKAVVQEAFDSVQRMVESSKR